MAELFQSYEARQRTGNGKRVLRWLAGSVALHLLLVASIVYVPALREAFQIASAFGGMEYGEEDYDLQDMGGGRVTYVRPGEMFQYPAGYFAKTQPPASARPEPAPSPTPVPKPKPTPKPTPAPSPKPTATPAASPVVEEGETTARADVNDETKKDDATTPENEPPKVENFKVNSKPFTDFFTRTKKTVDAGELDLSVPIRISVEADRTEDGRLTNFRGWSVVPNSPKHQKLAREFVAIISASKAFVILNGAKTVKLSGTLDAATVRASVVTSFDSELAASVRASLYSGLLNQVSEKRRGKNEEPFLKNTRISAVGRNIRVDMNLPRSLAGEVIAKQLPPG